MPKYSALAHILREEKIDEDLMFEGVHASGQVQACKIVEQQIQNYIANQTQVDPAYGYRLVYCMRTALVDKMEHTGEAPRSVLNPDGTVAKKQRPALHSPLKIKQASVKVVDKFSEEAKGDFNDPFTFEDGVIQTLKYY